MSVNVPTNPKIKEADINKKLQLYGIYSAFANGKVPSNKQIDVAMNSALKSRALAKPSPKLSSEGQLLVQDLRDVIEKAKLLLLTKNEGNLIQDFVYQCTAMSVADTATPNAPVDKETAKQHGNEALEGLRTLGQLVITNGQFRKLLNDAVVLLRDMAGDAAQTAAEKVNPDEEALAQIDRPADDNTWHDVPDVKGNLKDTINKVKPLSKGDVKDAANQAQGSGENTSGDAADAANAGASTGASALQDKASANVDDDTKQKAKETKEQAKEKLNQTVDKSKDYLSKKMPKERREQTIWRLKKMVVEIQGHQDYQRAIDTLLRLAETYQGHAANVTGQSKETVKGAHTDDSLKSAEADLKVLLERFANSTSSDDLFDAINQIYRDADNDPELKGWFRHLDTYVRKCLKEQGYIMQDESTTEWNKIYDQGNFLFRDRYRNHTNRIGDEFKFLGEQFDKDPQNKAFADSMQKLFNDLGNDENGKPTFKPHLLKDLSDVIVPAIFENIRYVPIPRIEYSDPMADAIIENLVIEGDNLAPNVFEFASDNYFRWGRRNNKNDNKNKVMLSVSGIQMDLRDVSYYVKKKQGFPSISDKGVMDIFLGGSGFSFKAALETADKTDKNHFFKVNSVVVDLKHMNIKLKQSKHKLLFALVKPLLLRVMTPILTKVIAAQIKIKINELDGFCYEVKKEADRAAAEAKNNPEQAQNIYKRYVSAAQAKLTKGKNKAQETAQDKQVNVAMTQHDSIFKDIRLPGGISSKATDYKDLAAKGDKWESPVFSIGSASESANIPKPAAVTRKQHSTAPGELKPKSESSYGNANGFSNQVSSAFDSGNNDLSLKSGSTTVNNTHTTLGSSNPVLSGST